MRHSALYAVLLSCSAFAVASCGGAKAPRPSENPAASEASVTSEPLIPSEDLKPPMFLQQRLSGKHGEKSLSISCVLQLSQGMLTVIGLTPFGSKAFVLTQQGLKVELEKFVDHEVPFAPERVIEDIQRVLFRRVFAHDFSPADGVHEIMIGGERVREVWGKGALQKRDFLPVNGGTPVVTVVFSGAHDPLLAPRVELHNHLHGYSLTIDTVAQRILPQ